MNYFDLFGLEASPKVEKTALNKKYILLQRQHHPDFHTQLSGAELTAAEEHAALINKAYKTLMDDQSTLQYFLMGQGLIREDEKFELPPDFLMEMMELNEAMEENDAAQAKRTIDDFGITLINTVNHVLNKPVTAISGGELQALKLYYYKKKYLDRILDRLKD
jgi:molecular chaperone HscB